VLNISSPKEIYSKILEEVDKLLLSFENQEKDEEIAKAQKDAQKQLNVSRQEIQDSISQLKKNSEWDVFTIAFYGETNAGKSTLIETLRILLSEPEKNRERQEFSRLLKEYDAIQKALEECQKAIDAIADEYKDKIEGIDAKLQAVAAEMQKKSDAIAGVKKRIDELSAAVQFEKKASVIKFIRYLFKRLPPQKELKECENDLNKKEKSVPADMSLQDELLQSKEELNNQIEQQTKERKEEFKQLNNKLNQCSEQMIANSDGRIIGDGRSDYTRTVASYTFMANDQKFALLDLPGIEGNEGAVLDAINMAVQKAHAVFYITGKPTPPQTGDGNVEGTLEKIKKHLGQQTEVFSVFNKRVKNPNSLKEQLVDEDETNSLKVLDETIRFHLGDQYQRCVSLSAYPAFLSVANCWQNDFETKKKKFIEHFESPELLMQRTKVDSFASWLAADIVINCKEKIKRSNFKKAVVVLDNTAEGIRQIHSNFMEFKEKLVQTKKATDAQLDESMAILEGRFDAETHSAIENFKNTVRNKIYKDIDDEINNSEFKTALEKHSNEGIKKMQRVLEENFKKVTDDFKNEVSDIIKKYQKYAAELLKAYSSANKFDKKFELKIDIKSGVNWVGLISSVVGGILAVVFFVSSPAGWVALALSIVGALVSIGKAIVGVFNHNYRKSQQKKSADENIAKMGKNILGSIKKNLVEAREPLRSGIEDIKNELSKTVDRVKIIIKILASTQANLAKLTLAVKTEGDY